MSVIDFRFEEENVICEIEGDVSEDTIFELGDSIMSYMDAFVGDDPNYNPVEITSEIMANSGLKYRIIEPDHCIFVE